MSIKVITFNGRSMQTSAKNLVELLLTLGVQPQTGGATMNGMRVPYEMFEKTHLNTHDVLEFVPFVGAIEVPNGTFCRFR